MTSNNATAATTTTTLPPALAQPIDCLLIDNFDSFTWNLYQQLSLLGARVTVIRNDAIPAAALPQLDIKSLIISPGPGHPTTDSGISRDAVRYFSGKVPVLGVCMGLECIVDVYGGTIGCVFSFSLHDARHEQVRSRQRQPTAMRGRSNMANSAPFDMMGEVVSKTSHRASFPLAIIPSVPL